MTDGDFTEDTRESSLFNQIYESDVFNLDVLFFPFSIYVYYIFLLVYDIFLDIKP